MKFTVLFKIGDDFVYEHVETETPFGALTKARALIRQSEGVPGIVFPGYIEEVPVSQALPVDGVATTSAEEVIEEGDEWGPWRLVGSEVVLLERRRRDASARLQLRTIGGQVLERDLKYGETTLYGYDFTHYRFERGLK